MWIEKLVEHGIKTAALSIFKEQGGLSYATAGCCMIKTRGNEKRTDKNAQCWYSLTPVVS